MTDAPTEEQPRPTTLAEAQERMEEAARTLAAAKAECDRIWKEWEGLRAQEANLQQTGNAANLVRDRLSGDFSMAVADWLELFTETPH